MKKLITIIALLGITAIAHGQSSTITSWVFNTNGGTGYNCSGCSPAHSGTIESNIKSVYYTSTDAYISCAGVPSYNVGPWSSDPNVPTDQSFVFKITLTPTTVASVTVTTMGQIGVWSNGVTIYNPKDGYYWDTATSSFGNTVGVSALWNRNAYVYEVSSFDACLGHADSRGSYHNHVNPKCLYDATDSTSHSPIIGYAFDGNPVYGAYGYANTDGSGGIKRMKSGYSLTTATTRLYGPTMSAYAAGSFCEDYVYSSGTGDLDAHNGRTCVTPEYPGGTYAYFVTINSAGTPQYPFVIGNSFYGYVQSGNTLTGGHNTIPGTAVLYNPVSITGTASVCVGSTTTLSSTISSGTWTSSSTAVATVGSATGVVTGVASGTCNITYSVTGYYATKTVTVGATPGTFSGSTSVCVGSTSTLTNSVTGGTWSGGNSTIATIGTSSGTVTAVASGTTIVTYTLSSGCTKSTTITVITLPSSITGTTGICTGATTTLSSTTTGGTWTSGTTTVATVGSSSGTVTGVTAGTSAITYKLSTGCSVTTTVTVNSSPAAITGTTSVCTGATTTLSNSIIGGTWSSGNTSVATVTSGGVVNGVAAGTALISYTISCGTVTATVTVNAAPSTAGTISGSSSVCTGANTTLTSTTSGGAWSSGATSIATVTSGGAVYGVSAGTATISYTVSNTCGSIASTATMTVNASPSAGTISGSSSVCAGANTTLSSTVSGGIWSSSSTSIATITSGGVVNGVTAGTTTISYTVSNTCGSAVSSTTFTVTATASAGTISGSSSVCTGATATLSSTVSGGTWSAVSTSIATITSGGVVSGVSAGTTIISYTVTSSCGTAVSTTTMTVNASPGAGSISGSSGVCTGASTTLSSTVSGGTWSSSATSVATVTSGGVVNGVAAGTTTISYTVTNTCGSAVSTAAITVNTTTSAGTISGSSSVNISSTITLTSTVSGGSWSMSNGNATITSGGVITGVTAGTDTAIYTVTNTCGSTTATKTITVNGSIGAITGTTTVCAGSATTLSDSTSGGVWTSGSTSVASVGSGSGIVTGVAAGTAVITYTLLTSYVTATVTVNALPSTITGTATVCTGATTTLANSVNGGAWSSGAMSVATVTSGGVVNGVSAGTAVISYTTSCGTATATVTVNATPGSAGSISGSASICAGSVTTLTDGVSGGVWSSSATAIATVTTGGIVSGVSAGTTTISYTVSNTCGSVVATTVVTVNTTPGAGTISGSSSVNVSSTITLTNTVSGGTWSMSNGNATITSGGVVTGVAAGIDTAIYTVTTSCGTASATKAINIGGYVSPITGTATACTGSTTMLSDSTSGGVWSSGTTTVATVGSGSGIVTGVAAGTAVITYTVFSSYATMIVTVSTSPQSITGTTSICGGAVTTLSSVTSGGTWSSSNTAVASVGTSTGIVTGISGGSSTITYMLSSGCYKTTSVNIGSVSAITGTPAVCLGATATLSDTAIGGTWTSSNTAAATIGSASGIMSGVAAPATTTITYTPASGCKATVVVTVNTLPSAITGTATVCAGATTTLSSTSTGGAWSSSNTSIATATTGTGVITGVSGGSATITYMLTTGCVAVKAITVNALPAAISGSTTLCAGTNTTLTNTLAGGTWTSSNTSVASVGSTTGTVIALANGTATITYAASCGVATTVVTIGGAPTISSVSPNVDTVAASVMITGSNFNTTMTNNIVYFGAVMGTVSTATATSLTVTMPAGATFRPVTVENTGCALTAYAQYPFLPTYNNSAYIPTTISLSSKVDFTTGANPIGVAIGDIDGDGKPDIISANYSSNTISVFRNTSTSGAITSGSFAAKVDFTTGAAPYSVAIGDLDNDGKLDVVVANNSSSPATVSVFRNTATSGTITSSSLAAKVDIAVSAGPIAVAIGDLDMDGKADIAVANNGANTISVLRNISTSGTITTSSFATKVEFASGSHPFGIAIGDIDGDGKPELAVPNQSAATVSIFRNTSSAGSITTSSFAARVDFTTGSQPYAVTLGDMDGDGKLDVVVANNAAATVSVFRNTATSGSITSGSLAAKVDFATGAGPYAVAIADINGDGKPDLAIANRTANTVSVLRNTAASGSITSSSFAAKTDFTTGSAPASIALGDLDRDGIPDIATVNIGANTLSVLRNNPVLHPSAHGNISGSPVTLCIGATVTFNAPMPDGTWSSTNSNIAAIDEEGMVTGVAAGRTTVNYVTTDGNYSVPVIVTPLPDAVFITANPGTNIQQGQHVTLTAAVQNDAVQLVYQWLLNGVAIPGAINASYSSDHFVNNDVVACVAGSSICEGHNVSNSVTIHTLDGNDQVIFPGSNLALQPSPNNGTFTVSGSLDNIADQVVAVEIADMLGQVVYRNSVAVKGGRINEQIKTGNGLANGIYLLNLRSGSENKVFRFVVQQ